MRWQGRKQSSNVEDRRGQGSRIGGKGTGIIGIIILLVGAYYGVDLSGVVGTPQIGTAAQQSTLNSEQEAQLNELSRVVLADTETVWADYFSKRGSRYTRHAGALHRRHPNRLWHRPSGDGAVLLPCRPQSVFGFIILRRYAQKTRCGG